MLVPRVAQVGGFGERQLTPGGHRQALDTAPRYPFEMFHGGRFLYMWGYSVVQCVWLMVFLVDLPAQPVDVENSPQHLGVHPGWEDPVDGRATVLGL